MRNIFIITIFFNCCLSCFAQEQDSIGKPELFNFDLLTTDCGYETKRGRVELDNGWLKSYYSSKDRLCQQEYAPANDFYVIIKEFHPNGMIKSRGKMLINIKYGLWEFFDENGKLEKTIDEDKKFGRIKPDDIVRILEKAGVIDRKQGTSETNQVKEGNTFVRVKYGTSGKFYENVKQSKLHIIYKKSNIKFLTSKWEINYFTGHLDMVQHKIFINGTTGWWKKSQRYVMVYI